MASFETSHGNPLILLHFKICFSLHYFMFSLFLMYWFLKLLYFCIHFIVSSFNFYQYRSIETSALQRKFIKLFITKLCPYPIHYKTGAKFLASKKLEKESSKFVSAVVCGLTKTTADLDEQKAQSKLTAVIVWLASTCLVTALHCVCVCCTLCVRNFLMVIHELMCK